MKIVFISKKFHFESIMGNIIELSILSKFQKIVSNSIKICWGKSNIELIFRKLQWIILLTSLVEIYKEILIKNEYRVAHL